MLSYLAILFPCILSGLWFLVFATRFTKSTAYQHLTFLAGLTAAFFFVDACYCMNGVSTRTIIAADILKQFISPCMGLYCWYYFCALKKNTKTHSSTGYLIAIPTFLMAVAAITYLIMGYHDADLYIRSWEAQGHYPDGFEETIFQLNKFICVDCYNAIEFLIVAGLLIFLITDLFTGYTFSESIRALFKKERVSIHHIQCIHFIHFLIVFGIKVILGRGYLLSHPVISTLLFVWLGIIVLLICAAGIMGTAENVTLGRVYFGFSDKDLPVVDEKKEEAVKEKDATEEENETADEAAEESSENDDEDYVEDNMGDDGIDDEEPEQVPGYHVSTIKYDESLVDRFKVAVVEKKLYLKNGLTIRDVCEELGSNKTYISKMVNERFGMPFPNYINKLRVDYAKQYLLDHPDAKQEEIADECGFPNAAGFNRSFKKETGTTPRIWLAKNQKK